MTTKQRRVWNFIPENLQTSTANVITSSTGDIMFEPENAGFISGYIGDASVLSPTDIARTPQIMESDSSRQKYQLSPAAVVTDTAGNITDGVFYDDLVRFISANGAITNDENRLFATPYYSWSPPIDYDKHINFSKYYWMGDGDAVANGNYVIKEMYGSQLFVHVVTNGAFVTTPVKIMNGLPTTAIAGDIVEDASTKNRLLYQYDGIIWKTVNYKILLSDSLVTDFQEADIVYIPKTGKINNRFSLTRYSEVNGRWLVFHPIVSNIAPENPSEGMLWEDITNSPSRGFSIYTNGVWQQLTFEIMTSLNGVADSSKWFYDIRMISTFSANNNTSIANDYWGQDNWWVHYSDMSPDDKSSLGSTTQATRPIIEYWASIASLPILYANYSRNTAPQFNIFTADPTDRTIKGFDEVDATLAPQYSSIYYYARGTGTDDLVLGFPLVYNTSGEYTFDINIESKTIQTTNTNILGYRYFKDEVTGFYHSIWRKSASLTKQNVDVNGNFDVPANIKSNADHINPTSTSRSQYLSHMASVIASQTGISGYEYGINNYRWTEKNIDLGAVIIDCENSLLRTMALLTSSSTNIPDVVRYYTHEYNKAIFRFISKLNSRFEEGVFFDVAGRLTVDAVDAVDDICTELFFAKNNQFAYYYSGMGTYIEKNVGINGIAVINTVPKPIMIPTSAAIVGTSQAYKPSIFIDYDGINKIRGHDGSLYTAYNDGRDLIILELENRFFGQIPTYLKTETSSFSSRFSKSNLILTDYYGNFVPTTDIVAVDKIVDNYLVAAVVSGTRVFSRNGNLYANWSGQSWYSAVASVDDVFFNKEDASYYIFNGYTVNKINYWNNNKQYSYSYNEYMSIVRRDFERWSISRNLNFVENNTFDLDDKFTWNYRTSGLEGYYAGIYRRVFKTPRIHSHPWEILGYTICPDWWLTTYVPSSISSDGTPRYVNTHAMWNDIANGIYNKPMKLQNADFAITAPFPVDSLGELVDPITAGLIDIAVLDMERISDGWAFGDGAPIEQLFFASSAYAFSNTLSGYLMKPGIWLDSNWAHLFIDIGENQLLNGPSVVYDKTLTRASISAIPISLGLNPDSSIVTDLGIQMWVAEYLKRTGLSSSTTLGAIINTADVQLGWKAAGFLNNNRTVVQKLSGTRVPFEDMSTIIHTTPPVGEYFSSGMLIVRDGVGYRVYGYDIFNPYFTIDEPNVPTAGGLTELREQFIINTNQNVFIMNTLNLPLPNLFGETASIAVILNGISLQPQYYKVTDNKTLTLDPMLTTNSGDILVVSVLTTMSNPSTKLKTFKVKGVNFTYASEGTGNYVNYEYGRYFDTSPQVINFMIGYGRYLQKQGWVFADVVAGSPLDWINGAKQFATWVLNSDIAVTQGQTPTTEFFFSPIAKNAKFSASFGTVTSIESFQNGAYGIINSNALPINSKKINIVRIGDTISIKSEYDNEDIYGIRLYVVETQHVIFFSNITKFGDLIYDPLLSLAVDTLKVSAYRTLDWSGKFEADGFIIQNNNLIPNFEKQTTDITRYYDRINTVDDPIKRDAARALVGWVPNDLYMDPIGADDRSRFDYHIGMIKAKGTRRPTIAFAKGTSIGADNVELSENWLWRVGEFGDTRKSINEFVVAPSEILDSIQVIRFTDIASTDPRILTINSFNRGSSATDTRWIYPATTSTNGLSNIIFPTTRNCIPQTADFSYNVKIINRNTGETVLDLFHYDPQIGKFDPTTLTQIDYWGPSDPARYTDGYGATYSNNNSWGETQIGQIWWDVTNLSFTDYTAPLPDYRTVAKEWGKLKYFNLRASLSGDTLTMQTLDPYTGSPAAHGFSYNGSVITLTDMNPSSLNGIYAVTVVDTTTLQTTINAGVTLSSTSGTMIAGSVDVYQWIRSTITPSQYITQGIQNGSLTALPYGLENASYATVTTSNSSGKPVTYYYYWIKSLSTISNSKEFTAQEIALRLQDPVAAGTSWFAPINQDSMLVHLGGLQFEDGFSIQVIIDGRKWDSHDEWLVFSENSSSVSPPLPIFNKIIDSLLRIDAMGNLVPSNKLGKFERYGTATFPAQTLYNNVTTARTIFLSTLNTILSHYSINDNLTIKEMTNYLTPSYWNTVNYINSDYVNQNITDTVASIAERDRRTSLKYFINGDTVKVLPNTIDNTTTSIWYTLANKVWTPILYENSSVAILPALFYNSVKAREILTVIFNYITIAERNELVYACVYAMLYQNPDCDWFEKTSYLDMRISTEISTAGYVQPDQVQAIIDNFEDTKPFRTKVRNVNIVENFVAPEISKVTIVEEPVIKINHLINRLNLDLGEEGGADGFPADVRPADYTHGYFNNYGVDEFYFKDVIICDGSSNYEVVTKYSPLLYKTQVAVYYNGVVISLDSLGLTFTTEVFDHSIIIVFSTPLTSDFSVEVLLGRAYYPDIPTTFNPIYDNTFIKYYGKDLQHRTYTYMQNNFGAPESAQERVNTSLTDNIFISMKTDTNEYMLTTTNHDIYPAGQYMYPTSTDIISADGLIFEDLVTFNIVGIMCQGTMLVAGVDYTIEFTKPYNRVLLTDAISTNTPLTFIYNGWDVGDIGTWTWVSSPALINYNEGYLTLDTGAVPLNQFIILKYKTPRIGKQKVILFDGVTVVNDSVNNISDLENITYYGLPANTYKIVVIDSVEIVMWDGDNWIPYSEYTPWESVYVISSGIFYSKNNVGLLSIDDTALRNNVIGYENFL